MNIVYRTKKLEKVCEDATAARKQYGDQMASVIHQRIDQIRASESVEMMCRFRVGGCHPLSIDRKGQYAMHLVEPQRLVFEEVNGEVQIVRILDIIDYHR